MRACLVLAVIGASSLARTAAAAPHAVAVDLAWDAPATCPARAHVVLEIERLLARDLAASPDPIVRVVARVREVGDSFVLEVETTRDGETRRREVRDPACAPLAQAAASIVALAVDPGLSPEPAANRAATPAAPIPPAALAPPRDRKAPEPRSPGVRVRALFGAAAALDSSALPTAAAGVTGFAGASLGALTAEARALYLPAQRAEVRRDVGGNVALAAGGARVCYAPFRPARFALGPCAGFEAGVAMAEGFGVARPSSGVALWAAPGLGLRGTYDLTGPLDAVATVEGVFPLVRGRFVLDPTIGEVHALPAASARLEVGVRLAIP